MYAHNSSVISLFPNIKGNCGLTFNLSWIRIFLNRSGLTSSSMLRLMSSSSQLVYRTGLCRYFTCHCDVWDPHRLKHETCLNQSFFLKVYEGLVYMDFSKHLMDERGHGIVFDSFLARLQTNYFISLKMEILFFCIFSIGEYIPLDMTDLPLFWLAYLGDPSDSGRIHSNVSQRWLNGKFN